MDLQRVTAGLELFKKFGLNYLSRPFVRKERQRKKDLTKELFAEVYARGITDAAGLPSFERSMHDDTAKKMLHKLREFIKFGGLTATTEWVDKLILKERPNFASKVPKEVNDFINQMRAPDWYEKFKASVDRGILLRGLPGTGKSTLGKLIAHQTGCVYLQRSAANLVNKYVGTGPNNLKKLFLEADGAARAAHRKLKEQQEQDELKKLGVISRFFTVMWRKLCY